MGSLLGAPPSPSMSPPSPLSSPLPSPPPPPLGGGEVGGMEVQRAQVQGGARREQPDLHAGMPQPSQLHVALNLGGHSHLEGRLHRAADRGRGLAALGLRSS